MLPKRVLNATSRHDIRLHENDWKVMERLEEGGFTNSSTIQEGESYRVVSVEKHSGCDWLQEQLRTLQAPPVIKASTYPPTKTSIRNNPPAPWKLGTLQQFKV